MSHGIPVTYVAARNTIFLSFALAWAETLGSSDIFIGVNAFGYCGYPDCRPGYIAAYEAMANLATRAGVEGAQKLKIHAPLIGLTKAQIVQEGLRLGVDYAETSSCYDPSEDGRPCGACDSCLLRAKGFAEAGVKGPWPSGSQWPDPDRADFCARSAANGRHRALARIRGGPNSRKTGRSRPRGIHLLVPALCKGIGAGTIESPPCLAAADGAAGYTAIAVLRLLALLSNCGTWLNLPFIAARICCITTARDCWFFVSVMAFAK
jgi:hypothetical protein